MRWTDLQGREPHFSQSVLHPRPKGPVEAEKARQYVRLQACNQLKMGIPVVILNVSDFFKPLASIATVVGDVNPTSSKLS